MEINILTISEFPFIALFKASLYNLEGILLQEVENFTKWLKQKCYIISR